HPLSGIGDLGALLDQPVPEAGGGPATLNNSGVAGTRIVASDPAYVRTWDGTSGAGYRLGADLGDPDGSTCTTTADRPSANAAMARLTVSLRAGSAPAVHGARRKPTSSDFVMVRVHTSEGATGYGEVSATPRWSGEDAVSATHFIKDVLAPAVIGQPLLPVSALSRLMETTLAANPFTRAGLNMALWDALGRTLGLRVTELLGG